MIRKRTGNTITSFEKRKTHVHTEKCKEKDRKKETHRKKGNKLWLPDG